MSNVAHLSDVKELNDIHERISSGVCEAKAVVLALSSGDNFTTLHDHDVAACLNVILGKLNEISEAL